MDLIGRLHEDSPLFISRADFEQSLADCEIEPVEEDGRVIGCFVIKGPEIHYAKFDTTTVGKRHLARLAQVIEQYGYATTKTPKHDTRQVRFNQRLGGVIVGETEHDHVFRFERSTRCQ